MEQYRNRRCEKCPPEHSARLHGRVAGYNDWFRTSIKTTRPEEVPRTPREQRRDREGGDATAFPVL
jgi:hypothetical protein